MSLIHLALPLCRTLMELIQDTNAPEGTAIFTLTGPLDFHLVDDSEREQYFVNALGEQWLGAQVAMDLSEMDFIDSSAIGWFIGLTQRFKQHQGRIVFFAAQPTTRRVFELMRLNKVLTLADNRDDAMQHFSAVASD